MLIAFLIGMMGSHATLAEEPNRHPLDPLVAGEYETAVEILQNAGVADEGSLYHVLTLDQPAKGDVISWKRGDTLPRRAFCVLRSHGKVIEAVVDLNSREVVRETPLDDIQPNILLTEEWDSAVLLVQADARWRAALAKRGLRARDVVCVPLTAGFFDEPDERNRRLTRVVCFDRRNTRNFWGRPVEGLVATVDHARNEVVEILDTGVVPVPGGPVDFDTTSVGTLQQSPRPIRLSQPEGASFQVSGHEVRWQNWRFHLRIDPRVGPVVSRVRYEDGGRLRSILYQGYLSELFVPYMDPDPAWYFRTYLDVGEYGIGKLVAPLQIGRDCPEYAHLFSAEFVDDYGNPYRVERAACVFERFAGDPLWRHHETIGEYDEVRRDVELVVRFATAVGNYDYVLDWVFRLDGSIRVAVGASGIAEVRGVRGSTAANAGKDDLSYGHMVAEHTVATNHDHFFCFRLDLDVDGPVNGFVVERLNSRRLGDDPASSPRRSVWVVDSQQPATEADARLQINLKRPALWRIINPEVRGPLGYPVSYQVKPGVNAVSLLAADDFPQRRAGFTDYHLWVTPHDRKERYAAGDYPNQHPGGAGLPAWIQAGEAIQNRDIVVWYTLGFHHVVRTEDWPVLPMVWHDFELRPFDFFPRNPAVNLME